MLRLENLLHLILNRAPRRFPPKRLARPLSLTTRVQSPTNSFKSSLLERLLLLQRLLLGILQIPQLHSFLAHKSRKISPDVLATLCERVAFGAPELGVGAAGAGYGGFDEQDVGVGEVSDVDVVPARLARADDGDVLASEDQFGELVDLAAALVNWAASVAWVARQPSASLEWRLLEAI
jgi:hypothetical protein